MSLRYGHLVLSFIIARWTTLISRISLTSVCLSMTPAIQRTKPPNAIYHAPLFLLFLVPPLMLLYSLLALSLISYPTSAQPTEPNTNRAGGLLLSPSGSPQSDSGAGNLGSSIGGEGVIFSGPIECSNVFFCIPIRRFRSSRSFDHDRPGVCDASPVTKTKLPAPQPRAGRGCVVPTISEAER